MIQFGTIKVRRTILDSWCGLKKLVTIIVAFRFRKRRLKRAIQSASTNETAMLPFILSLQVVHSTLLAHISHSIWPQGSTVAGTGRLSHPLQKLESIASSSQRRVSSFFSISGIFYTVSQQSFLYMKQLRMNYSISE